MPVDPAAVVRTSQNQSTSEGQAIVLECVLDGNPLFGAHVRWTRNGLEILADGGALSASAFAAGSNASAAVAADSSASSRRLGPEQVADGGGRTHIEWDERAGLTRLLVNPAVPQDSGVYRCSAHNRISEQPAESRPISVVVDCIL